MPQVEVIARQVETGVRYEARANEVGNYTLGSLPIGQYTVTFRVSGFKELMREGIALTSDRKSVV